MGFYPLRSFCYAAAVTRKKAPSDEGAVSEADWGRERAFRFLSSVTALPCHLYIKVCLPTASRRTTFLAYKRGGH